MSCDLCFKLNEEFLEKYKTITPPFGYPPLGELVYRRTYSRTLDDGSKEDWWQTVRRVVEGTYSLQKEHIQSFHLGWDDEHGQRSAQEMYDLIFNMKFLPPGKSPFTYYHDSYFIPNIHSSPPFLPALLFPSSHPINYLILRIHSPRLFCSYSRPWSVGDGHSRNSQEEPLRRP